MSRGDEPTAAISSRASENADSPIGNVSTDQFTGEDSKVPARVFHHLDERDSGFLDHEPVHLPHFRHR